MLPVSRRKSTAIPPIGKDNALPGVTPTRRATLSSKGPNHERAMSVLNNVIQTITLVNNLVPLELGKGVLSSIVGILGIVKNTFANQGDFMELVEQCQTISLVIWRATAGNSKAQVDSRLCDALSNLQSSVDGIKRAVEEKAQKNIGSKIFHVTINQETIMKWRNELNKFLALFNTELNISTNLKLDELLVSFKEFCSKGQLTLQPIAEVPEELPVKPKIFVGRDDLVQKTIQSLLQSGDVALIGPGGMGKSSIARAVLNDEAITAKFEKRYFIRFDDMDAAHITLATFLDRIARSFGLSTVANTHGMVTKALSASNVLLILDNAETFLDAAIDAGRIADAIDGFGARHNVAILLTTRTSVLPPNLKWVRLRVPALEENDACDAFTMFYTSPIDRPLLVKLLAAVDFHPLSINLLAQAAIQNEWSSEDLINAWDRQRATLLEAGDGKYQNIAVTIETSLNSPSFLKRGTTILQLLQIIAYLPQGVNKQRLTAMFPGEMDIEACADTLCKQSLAYLNGGFITLLAPVRLYMTKRSTINISNVPLLNHVRQYYKTHAEEEEIVGQDDLNMEHVFAHWVTDPVAMSFVLDLIGNFIFTLLDCRPRPVTLYAVVKALDPNASRAPVSFMDFLKSLPSLHPRKINATIEKAICLFAISMMTRWIGHNAEAEDAIAEARALLLQLGRPGLARLILIDWGAAIVHIEQGDYIAAEKLLKSALIRSSSVRPKKYLKAILQLGLSRIDMFRGRQGSSKDCFKALATMKELGRPLVVVMVWYQAAFCEVNDGNLDLAKQYFQEAKAAATEESTEEFFMSSMGLAEIAYRLGEFEESKLLRAQTLESIQKIPDQTVTYAAELISMLATYLAMDGKVEQARELIKPIVANSAKNLSKHSVRCSYLAGCIEMAGGDFEKAEEYFKGTIDDCLAVSQISFQALSERALGELAVVRQDLSAARAHFEATLKLCKIMGITSDGMYRENACYMLNETFDGWKLYQDGHAMFQA